MFSSFWFLIAWGLVGFSVTVNAVSMRKMLQIWEHFRFLIFFQARDTQPVYCNNSYSYYTNPIFIAALTLAMMIADVHKGRHSPLCFIHENTLPGLRVRNPKDSTYKWGRGSPVLSQRQLWNQSTLTQGTQPGGPQCSVAAALRERLLGAAGANAESLRHDSQMCPTFPAVPWYHLQHSCWKPCRQIAETKHP